jgi:hypothetical protein
MDNFDKKGGMSLTHKTKLEWFKNTPILGKNFICTWVLKISRKGCEQR